MSRWIEQLSLDFERCSKCKTKIPSGDLYYRLSCNLDDVDTNGKNICWNCIEESQEKKIEL